MGCLYEPQEWYTVDTVENEDGPIDGPNQALCSGLGFVLAKTEFVELIKSILPFYDEYDDWEIKNYNHWLYHMRKETRIKRREKKDPRRKAKKRGPRRKTKNGGYVYLLFLECSGYYKIGLSNNPGRRVWKEISPVLPEVPELICTIKTNDMRSLEAGLHARFADKRGSGEWFRLNDEDVEYIKGLANGPKAI